MYNCDYRGRRVTSEDDALAIEPRKEIDAMLWALDVYDLSLGRETSEELYKRTHEIFMKWYHRLQVPLPFKRAWSFSMLLFIVVLTTMPERQRCTWKRVVQEQDTIIDFKEAMDGLALQWYSFDWVKVQPYVGYLFSVAKKWILHLHDCEHLSEKAGAHYKVQDSFITMCMGRYYWFHQTMEQSKWFKQRLYDIPTTHNLKGFLKKEYRHLKITKFRRELSTFLLERLYGPGDREIANHGTLNEPISGYSILMATAPGCFVRNVQNMCTYEDGDKLPKRHRQLLHFQLVSAHFIKVHKIPWAKKFMCWENTMHKHKDMLMQYHLPIVLELKREFYCLQNRVLYHGKRKTFDDAFLIWVTFYKDGVGTMYKDVDLSQTFDNILNPPTVVASQSRFYEIPV